MIENTFQQPVKVVSSLQEASCSLQSAEFSAVLVDQWATEAEPGQADYLIHHLGGAVPVFVNFGISGLERISRELRAALYRRGRETLLAQQNARILLRNSFKDDVTVLLLELRRHPRRPYAQPRLGCPCTNYRSDRKSDEGTIAFRGGRSRGCVRAVRLTLQRGSDRGAMLVEHACEFVGNVGRIPMLNIAALQHVHELPVTEERDRRR